MTFPLTDVLNAIAVPYSINKHSIALRKFEVINTRLIGGLNCQENDCDTDTKLLERML